VCVLTSGERFLLSELDACGSLFFDSPAVNFRFGHEVESEFAQAFLFGFSLLEGTSAGPAGLDFLFSVASSVGVVRST